MRESKRRKTAAIIVNPFSGKGLALATALEALFILKQAGVNVEIVKTLGPGHAREFAGNFASSVDVLVSVGGDGTLNEVANGVIEAGSVTPIAVVPTGTANVVARELALPKDLKAQVMLAVEGRVRRLDMGCAGGHHFAMCAGAGLDAAIVEAVARRRSEQGIGMWHYVAPAIREAWDYRYPPLRVTVDGAPVDESATFVVVGNISRYGGLFRLFEDASPEDGLLHVCCFHGRRLPDLMRYAWAAFRGSLSKLGDVDYYRGKRITLASDENVPVQIDGDPGSKLPMTLTVRPKAVSFCAPA